LTIDFDPEHISAHLELGDIIKHAAAKQANHANKRMLLDASNDYYERALKLNPSSEVANLKLAEGYMSKSEFEKSQNKFKDANLALEKSYQLLKTFLSKNSSPKALQLQGNTLVLQFILLENTPQGPKKLDEAIASLEKAFQLNPTLANIKKELDLAVWKKTGELSDRKFSP
jgi:tetratricopeptide (TPR) repeat protein